jgi:hypothetical protein
MKTDICTFLITSRWILLRMRNVSDKSCRENQNTHFVFGDFFESRTVYEIIWKNMVEPGRPQMTVRRMRIACWIPKATNTHWGCNAYCFSTASVVTQTRLISCFVKLHVYIIICRNVTVSLNCELCLSCPVTRTWAAIMIPQIKLRIVNRKESGKNGELERTLKLQQVELFNIVP